MKKKTIYLIILIMTALTYFFFYFLLHQDVNRIAQFVKHDYSLENKFQNSIQISKDEWILGFWDTPDKLLVVKKFKAGYFLIQRDATASYIVPRGRNLLSDSRTIIKKHSFNLRKLNSQESGIGGLNPPLNFPFDELKAMGLVKNNFGEWVKNHLEAEISINQIEGAVKYKLPDGINKTDWSQFSNLKLPEGILNVGGYGFPLYQNEVLQNGKVNLLYKGFSQVINLEALPRKNWSGENSYYFNQLYYLIKVAARNVLKSQEDLSKLGDIQAIASLEDGELNIPYQNITIEGAKVLGKHLFHTACCANSIDDKKWNIPLNKSVIMIDEESMTRHRWIGGDHYSFYGYLTEGMMDAAGKDYKIFWYAQPVQLWSMSRFFRRSRDLTEKDIEGLFNENNVNMNSPGWKNSTWYVDATGAYAKVPFLSQVAIYQKKDGKFVLDKEGKRKFRNDNFTISIFNKPVSILSIPDEKIRYGIYNAKTGESRFGREYVRIANSGEAYIKDEYVKEGFGWAQHGLARPYPQYWEPETKMWVDGIYRRANGIMTDLLMLAKLEKGTWNITKANTNYKLYGEHRPQTEPWTAGGNSVEVREVGESQIFYDTFMILMSGGQAVSSWDDGFYRTELPKKGEPLYNQDDFWGRYHAKLAAVQTVLKPLENSKSIDWTYIHFYYPYWGEKNDEVISSGIYYKDKFYVFFLNPTLEKNELQTLKLRMGSNTEIIQLKGHEVFYRVFDCKKNLEPLDFKLEYTTIYNRKVKVNGVVTDKLKDHYE